MLLSLCIFPIAITKVSWSLPFRTSNVVPAKRDCVTPEYLINNRLDSSLVSIHIKHRCYTLVQSPISSSKLIVVSSPILFLPSP